MAVTNEFERDFTNQAQLKRPGRVDMIVFQNVADAGDGSPGIQRCFRNYLHEGGMEKDIDFIGFGIKGTSVNINNAELQQLSNIGASVITASIWSQIDNIEATTISPTQWGYVGVMDQNVRTSGNVAFGQITMSGNIIMAANNITFTTGLVDGVDVSAFKSDYDTHKASSGADHTYIDQSVVIASSPTFVGLTLSANLVTSSTVDGVDVSAIKLNSMPTAADGDIDANSQKIINVVDPTLDQGAATKKYVDDYVKAYLPIGTILMFNGAGWVDNSTVPGWYKCDGNNGTVNLVNKFVRGGTASGSTGGSDNSVNIAHGHGVTDPAHKHLNTVGGGSGGLLEATSSASFSSGQSTAIFDNTQITNISIDSSGVSGTGKNIPAYYTLIYIQRIS